MKLEKNAKMYGTLFSSVFMLSARTFGGGYVIVPLMRKKFVEDPHPEQSLAMPRSVSAIAVPVSRGQSLQSSEQYFLRL